MTNRRGGILYVGVTSDIRKRVFQHKEEFVPGFTKKYHLHHLVYFETTGSIEGALAREKQIKAGSRKRKVNLIEEGNPFWKDLSDSL